MKLLFLPQLLAVFLVLSCGSEPILDDHGDCVFLEIPTFFNPENNYQMVYLGNINRFVDSSNCFRLKEWINQELYTFEGQGNFLDTLYKLNGLPDIGAGEYISNEYIRLFRYNFAFGSGSIKMIDCINKGTYWTIKNCTIEFDRKCNFPKISIKDGEDFSLNCFSLIDCQEKKVPSEQFEVVRNAMQETDFLNIAYFDTGEIRLCDGYDIQIIYDGKSSNIDSHREFYRSCPGRLSPIGVVSNEILKL